MGQPLMNKIADALMKTLLYEKVTVIHAAYEDPPHKVASIIVEKTLTTDEKLEKSYVLTNTIDNAWWNNKGVTKLFKGNSCRSTSPGDMVMIGEDMFECEVDGWSKI